MSDQQLYQLAQSAGKALEARAWMMVSAESCTGGWIGEAMTMVPGSSAWYERGFITYTNIAKNEMLGVSMDTLQRHGAVSERTVSEMAAGALARSHAQVAVAVSGVAGPGGGSPEKPVGTVCFAWAVKNGAATAETRVFPGDRAAVRRLSVEHALAGVIRAISG
jgi:nicotinamide-nucleotide amidase